MTTSSPPVNPEQRSQSPVREFFTPTREVRHHRFLESDACRKLREARGKFASLIGSRRFGDDEVNVSFSFDGCFSWRHLRLRLDTKLSSLFDCSRFRFYFRRLVKDQLDPEEMLLDLDVIDNTEIEVRENIPGNLFLYFFYQFEDKRVNLDVQRLSLEQESLARFRASNHKDRPMREFLQNCGASEDEYYVMHKPTNTIIDLNLPASHYSYFAGASLLIVPKGQ